jgi:hypothetical protein
VRTFIPLLLTLICSGCETIEFDATPQGGGQSVRVTNDQDVQISLPPLQYRMRADEGHLIVWIENPTNVAVELVGDNSAVIDPQGDAHPLLDQMILPGAWIKAVFPPVYEGPPPPAGNPSANPINPYDRPGFISVPDASQSEQSRDATWQWDDELEIQLNLVFQRGQQQFQQQFSFRRVRK